MDETTYKKKKAFLKRYRKTTALIRRLIEKASRLEDRLTSVGSPSISDLPRGGTPLTSSDLILEKLELEERIERLKKKAQDQKHEILEAIDTLDDSRMAEVLEAHYIDCLDMTEIAEQSGYTVRHTYRLYTLALEAIDISSCQ